jgi:hypothetical protein
MKCPHCGRDLRVVLSGPYDHPMAPGLTHAVSSCCDTYLTSFLAPMPEGTVTPMRRTRREATALPEAA